MVISDGNWAQAVKTNSRIASAAFYDGHYYSHWPNLSKEQADPVQSVRTIWNDLRGVPKVRDVMEGGVPCELYTIPLSRGRETSVLFDRSAGFFRSLSVIDEQGRRTEVRFESFRRLPKKEATNLISQTVSQLHGYERPSR